MADDVTNGINALFATAIQDQYKNKAEEWYKDLKILIDNVNMVYVDLQEYQRLRSQQNKIIAENIKKQLLQQGKKIFNKNNQLNRATQRKIQLAQAKEKFNTDALAYQRVFNNANFNEENIEEDMINLSNEILLANYNKQNAQSIIKEKQNTLQENILLLYEYLQMISATIRGNKIQYHIITQGKTIENGYAEGDIPFQELQHFLNIEGRSDNYSLRLNLTVAQINELIAKKILSSFSEQNLKILNILRAFYEKYKKTGFKIDGKKRKVGNLGNLGEVYRKAILENVNIEKEENIKQLFLDVVSNIENFMTPDQGNEEIKALLGSSATFLSVKAVLNQGYKFLQILKEKNSNFKEDAHKITQSRGIKQFILTDAEKLVIQDGAAAIKNKMITLTF